MLRVSRMNVARFPATGQPCLSHHALHPLMIDLPTLPCKRLRHVAVSIASPRLDVTPAVPDRGLDRDQFGESENDAGNTTAD